MFSHAVYFNLAKPIHDDSNTSKYLNNLLKLSWPVSIEENSNPNGFIPEVWSLSITPCSLMWLTLLRFWCKKLWACCLQGRPYPGSRLVVWKVSWGMLRLALRGAPTLWPKRLPNSPDLTRDAPSLGLINPISASSMTVITITIAILF